MIGVILGLGFQWWPDFKQVWQYLAFIFIYLNLIDYWIDYSPTIKKFPIKGQFDVFLHTSIIFAMFFLIYTIRITIVLFFFSFIFYRLVDIAWIWRMKKENKMGNKDSIFMNTWRICDILEIILAILLISLGYFNIISSLLVIIIIFIVLRTTSRTWASIRYKNLYFIGSEK
jgi:hypothetical protein